VIHSLAVTSERFPEAFYTSRSGPVTSSISASVVAPLTRQALESAASRPRTAFFLRSSFPALRGRARLPTRIVATYLDEILAAAAFRAIGASW